jgi:hypothetical protein
MTRAFGTRRRAEQLDALVEGTLAQAPSAELGALLTLVDEVRALPQVEPRAEFAASLRERLMAQAPEALATPASFPTSDLAARLSVGRRTPGATPARASRERRIGVAIAAFSLVGATAASAVASQGSLPGDTLYPVKRLIEDARTSLAMGEDAKADVLLSQARTRLDEARELSTRDDLDAAQVAQTLRDFQSTADHASALVLAEYADHGDEKPVTELRTFAADGVTTISSLVGVLPASLNDTLADVADTLIAIDQSAAQVCSGCGAGITELPTQLLALLSATTGQTATPSASTSQPAPAPHSGTSARRRPSSAVPVAPVVPNGSPSATKPLTDAAGSVTGGGSGGSGGGSTSVGGAVGSVGGAVGGTVSGVGGAVSGTGEKVGGPVGGVVGGAGGAVSDVGDAVGDVTQGVGGLLGGPSPSPTP